MSDERDISGEDTRPSTPRAKHSTATRLQVQELVRTWLEMVPRSRRARVEYEGGVLWAIVSDERGHTARAPIQNNEDVWLVWGRAMGQLPPREA